MLGSSDGSPNQRVALSRPPVLEGSLKLRVREPLGNEEKEELLKRGADHVVESLGGRPGTWVLWHEVDDLADAEPGDRAYVLDDETGDVTFGDGTNGLIPPIGRDAIMAEVYKRGGGEAANEVKAWSQVNLISPIQGVEEVFAPDDAAGGSNPQADDEVLRFAPANQRMRNRALSLRDFETLALQHSAEIAQARARPVAGGVRLVIVMRGREPRPSPGVQRELIRSLLRRASPMLAERGGITVVPPEVVTIRVRLSLTIASIEQSGYITKDVRRRIEDLLDPASGGLDETGWPLGSVPTETDIAAALLGGTPIDGLEEVDAVEVWVERAPDTLERAPDRLRSTALAVLAPNGVTVTYSLLPAEAMA
jgi:predicted phage baseplate assembly protein